MGLARLYDRLWTVGERTWTLNLAVADQGMVSGVNFLTGVMLARILGLAEFGRFTLAWTIITAVNIVQQATIIDPMLSIGSKQSPERRTAYFSTVLVHQAILNTALILMVVAGLVILDRLAPDWGIGGLEWPIAAVIFGFQWQEWFRRYFLARNRFFVMLVNDGARYLLQITVLAGLLMSHALQVSSAMALWVISWAALVAILHGFLCFGPFRWSRAVIAEVTLAHWRFSRWVLPSAVLQAINGSIFFFAAGYFYGTALVGGLRAAQNLVGFTHILFLGLENTMQVRAAQAYAAFGKPALARAMRQLWIWGGGLVSVLLLGFCLEAGRLVVLIYGDQFRDVTFYVYLWAGAYALHFCNMPLRIAIRALECTRHFLEVQILVALFSGLSVYPLIETMGGAGVLVGAIGCYLIELLYLLAVLKGKLFSSEPRRHSDVVMPQPGGASRVRSNAGE
ncbi:MAG TPA: hypothetical protein VKT70_05390 [Stellaceae bacterium]|nr:hypothetical protein [Stellaceae bacterium]